MDGPTSFFTATSLGSRAEALSKLLDNMTLALRTLEAANAGAEAILRLLESAKGVVTGSQHGGTAAVFGVAEATGSLPFDLAGFGASNAVAADTPGTAVGTQPIAADVAPEITGASAALFGDDVAEVASDGILFIPLLPLGALLGQSITVNGETFNFGLFSVGEDLRAFIDNIVGLSATIGGNRLTITGDDADTAIDITYSSPLVGVVTGLSEGVEDPVNLLTQGAVAAGEDLTIQIGGFAPLVVTFGSDDGSGEVSTLAELDARLGLLAGGAASVDTGNGNISISAAGNGDDIDIGGTATLANFGISAGVYEPTNATLGLLAGVLTVQIGGQSDTITFGANDAGDEISTRGELVDRLVQLTATGNTGATFAIDGGDHVTVAAATAEDIVIDGDGAVLAALGFTSGQTVEPSNATLGGLSGSLTVTHNGATDTIVFGNDDAGDEVSTRDELALRLADLTASGNSGAAFTLDGNAFLDIAGGDAYSGITVDGDAGVLAAFGFAPGQAVHSTWSALVAANETLEITTSFGTDSVTFGTNAGQGEVSTPAQLEAALAGTLPNSGAAVTFVPGGSLLIVGPPGEDLAIGGSNSAVVASAFGLPLFTAVTIEQSNVEPTKTQLVYNALLDQIDMLARDSIYKNVNLLQEDDLRITFNERATASLVVAGTDLDSDGLGLRRAEGDELLVDGWSALALGDLEAAIRTVRERQGELYRNFSLVDSRRVFTDGMVTILQQGASRLTLANIDESGANLLALETRFFLGLSSLALATEAELNVLRIFA